MKRVAANAEVVSDDGVETRFADKNLTSRGTVTK